MEQFHGTTIISVRDTNSVALGGDGQVSLGDTVMKGNAVKVRKLYQIKYWPVSQAVPPMPLPCLKNLKLP